MKLERATTRDCPYNHWNSYWTERRIVNALRSNEFYQFQAKVFFVQKNLARKSVPGKSFFCTQKLLRGNQLSINYFKFKNLKILLSAPKTLKPQNRKFMSVVFPSKNG